MLRVQGLTQPRHLSHLALVNSFKPYSGDLIGLPTNEKHMVYRWDREDCKILFSCAERSNALSCHFASDKRGLRLLKEAINQWCDFVFYQSSYAKIIAITGKSSINRLIAKCGFNEVLNLGGVWVYERCR